jgi:hypothetical protein
MEIFLESSWRRIFVAKNILCVPRQADAYCAPTVSGAAKAPMGGYVDELPMALGPFSWRVMAPVRSEFIK